MATERALTLARAAASAGFSGQELVTMIAIGLGESSGNPRAHNPDASTGDNSYGLWQINMLGDMGPSRREWFGISSNEALFNPQVNARAARRLYDARGNFNDWSVYKRGTYRQHWDEARVAAQTLGNLGKAAQSAPPRTDVEGLSREDAQMIRTGEALQGQSYQSPNPAPKPPARALAQAVIDSASQMVRENPGNDEVRQRANMALSRLYRYGDNASMMSSQAPVETQEPGSFAPTPSTPGVRTVTSDEPASAPDDPTPQPELPEGITVGGRVV